MKKCEGPERTSYTKVHARKNRSITIADMFVLIGERSIRARWSTRHNGVALKAWEEKGEHQYVMLALELFGEYETEVKHGISIRERIAQ